MTAETITEENQLSDATPTFVPHLKVLFGYHLKAHVLQADIVCHQHWR